MDRSGMLGSCISLLVVALAVGCTSPPLQLYPGPPRPATEVAQLDAVNRSIARLFSVDGDRVRRAGSVLLEPGSHEVVAFVQVHHQENMSLFTITQYCYILVHFEAGSRYELYGVYDQVRADAVRTQLEVGAKIIDTTTGTEYHPSTCQGRMPDVAI